MKKEPGGIIMLSMNLNQHVKVKLTDRGKEILRLAKRDYFEADEEGFHRFQFWIFIEIFGSHMSFFQESVIEGLDVFIEEKDLITIKK
jgi:hypothetical protein